MIWPVIFVVFVIGFVFICIDKFRIVIRKERERRKVIDEMEVHELFEHYKKSFDFN